MPCDGVDGGHWRALPMVDVGEALGHPHEARDGDHLPWHSSCACGAFLSLLEHTLGVGSVYYEQEVDLGALEVMELGALEMVELDANQVVALDAVSMVALVALEVDHRSRLGALEVMELGALEMVELDANQVVALDAVSMVALVALEVDHRSRWCPLVWHAWP